MNHSQIMALANAKHNKTVVQHKRNILDMVMSAGGYVDFAEIAFKNTYGINCVTAVYFTKEYDDGDEVNVNNWNEYVQEIHDAIGVNSYCTWIRDGKGNMIGILAFYNNSGDEIKMKHFKRWLALSRIIEHNITLGNVVNM